MAITYEGQVAVVTGAGGGLGRAYALALASRGAKVVVNDLGTTLGGQGSNGMRPADEVVNAIRRDGGSAVADYNDAVNGHLIIETAIGNFGRVDILINNAGVLRDYSMVNMKEQDWDLVVKVHLKGAFACSKAAWPHMRRQKYGRIINTASGAGLYGNFGQANYAAAKSGLVGFTKVMAMEGAKYNINVNCIAPLAGTRMTEKVFPPEIHAMMKPECVAPVVLYLASKDCQHSGQIYEVAAGVVCAVRWQRNRGVTFKGPFTPDDVKAAWSQVMDFTGEVMYPESLNDCVAITARQASASVDAKSNSSSPQVTKSRATHEQDENVGSEKGTHGLQSARLFRLIDAFFQQDGTATAALKRKVDSCFHFNVAADKPKTDVIKWTINLKTDGDGRAREGAIGTADVVFSMPDSIFTSICLRKLNPQVAFLQGKMRIKGSMQKATRFTPELFPKVTEEMLLMPIDKALAIYTNTGDNQEPTKRTHAGGGEELSAAATKLKSAQLYPMLKDHLHSPVGNALVKKVGCIYRVNILPAPGARPATFYINLKTTPPTIAERPYSCKDPFDCSFTLLDDVFFKIATGNLNPQMAFIQGKMKIKGSTQAAMKFTRDMFPKRAKL